MERFREVEVNGRSYRTIDDAIDAILEGDAEEWSVMVYTNKGTYEAAFNDAAEAVDYLENILN